MLVVVSFDRRGCIQNFSSLQPLALLFLSGRSGRVVGWPNKLGIRRNSAQLKLAGLGLSLAKILSKKIWGSKKIVDQKNLAEKNF